MTYKSIFKILIVCIFTFSALFLYACEKENVEIASFSDFNESSIPAEISSEISEESIIEYDEVTKKTVDKSYFDDAVFIGNSRTQGLIYYNGLGNTTAYMDKGLKVDTVFDKPTVEMNGKKLSVIEALSEKSEFNKVYIMLGINELGWAYSDIFIEKYALIIDKIREINPDAIIYIQSILPVSEEKSSSDAVYNMDKINEYNDLIKDMATAKGTIYLNVSRAVADEDGYLPQYASTDGVHLNKDYCIKWFEYLKDNTY